MTRIFSVALYYHFAFMAISIALLGLGISGMALYLFPNFFSRKNSSKIMAWSSILFSLSILAVLFAIINLKIELYVTSSSVLSMAVLYLLLVLPFFFGGIIISLILTHFSDKISKLYFYDLIGASLGSIGVIFLLKFIGGPNGLIFISLLGLLIAIIISFYFKLTKTTIFTILLIISIFSLFFVGVTQNAFTLEFTRGAEDSEKEFSAWNAISRVDLFGNNNSKYMLIDSDASTEVIKIDDNIQEANYLTEEIHSLAYHIKPNSKSLIIGVGGGRDY